MKDITLTNIVENIKDKSIIKESFLIKDSYTYEDFTKYQDKAFITNIYKAFFGREPENNSGEELLSLLRNGNMSKMEIITKLRDSKEGRDNNVTLIGFKKRLALTLLYKIPLFSILATNQRTIDRIENTLYLTFKQEIEKLENRFHTKINALNREIITNRI